jgi:hypothetical protein
MLRPNGRSPPYVVVAPSHAEFMTKAGADRKAVTPMSLNFHQLAIRAFVKGRLLWL